MKKVYTPVIFRRFKGKLIALFPQEVGTENVETCLCYQRGSKHGAISVKSPMEKCEIADYAKLLRELEGMGYSDLKVFEKFGYFDKRIRAQKIKSSKLIRRVDIK